MEFATVALLAAGMIAGFLPGLAVGWHARPTIVEVTETDPPVQAGDNEIVTEIRSGEVTR